MKHFLIAGLAAMTFLDARATSGVLIVDLDYQAVYDQSGPGISPALRYVSHNTRLFTKFPDVFSSVTLLTPTGAPYPLTPWGGGRFELWRLFVDKDEAELAYPLGTYKFQGLGGSASGATGLFPVYEILWPSAVPQIDGPAFEDLRTKPAETDVQVSWNSFLQAGHYVAIYFQLYDLTDARVAAEAGKTEMFNSFLIKASERQAGHRYQGKLVFTVAQWSLVDGFIGVEGHVGFRHATFAEFAVPARPGTIAGQITLEGFQFASGEPVQLQVLDAQGNILEQETVVLGDSGTAGKIFFAHQSAVRGTRTVRLKGKTWLSQSITVDLDSGFGDLDLTLKNGDIDGDDTVTIFDYIALSENFDESSGGADWDSPSGSGFSGQDCDLDRDEYVTIFDYILLSGNFDESGS